MPTRKPLRLGRLADDQLAALAAVGDERAFETLYDRHHRALLGFCRHMLGAREEAEDALQQTFLRAHRSLAGQGPPAELRPWLFTIARNCCITMLSGRRPFADGETELASTEGLGEQVQVRADLRAVVADVERLPDEQRAALVLAELADLSHDQIAEVIDVRPGKVKALIHQARTTLIAEREARETPCETIREQLSTARGGALRRGPLRRHLRVCASCRAYREAVGEQRRVLALALPATPSLGLKAGILGAATATGGAVGGVSTAASLGGGLAAKLVAGAIVVGGTAGGVAAVDHQRPAAKRPSPATHARTVAASASAAPVAVLSRPPRIRPEGQARGRAVKRGHPPVGRGRRPRPQRGGRKRAPAAKGRVPHRSHLKAGRRPADAKTRAKARHPVRVAPKPASVPKHATRAQATGPPERAKPVRRPLKPVRG